MLVNEFLEHSAGKRPNKIALVCDQRCYSFAEINSLANKFANQLIDTNLERQDRVAVYLENSVEEVITIFGALKAGGIIVVINPQVKACRLEYILKDCNVRVLVTSYKLLQSVHAFLGGCADLEHVMVADSNNIQQGELPKTNQFIISSQESLKQYPDRQPPKRCIDIDLASLIYTSGSTGNPKGVMLTHLNMVSAANSIIQYLKNTSDDIILSCLPLSFDYGLYQILMAFKFGGTVILERTFAYPYQALKLMKEEKVTGFPIVPAMAAILLQLKDIDRINLPHMRYITNTAQALPPKHILRLAEIFPSTRIYSMYGLTECKRVSYLPPEEVLRRPASVGKAMPNVETYIVDAKGYRISEAWKTGELVVRGNNVMRGYWNLPDETAKRLQPGVYPGEYVLHTGDSFQMDEEGYLYFISRKDDLIKTGGEMVSPKEVENVIYEIPDVVEVAVIPNGDPILGKAIKAVVVLSPGSALTEKDIIKHCSQKLENHKIPKYVEIRFDLLPKTPTGKIASRELS